MRNVGFLKADLSLFLLAVSSWCVPSAFATSVPTTTTLAVTSGSNPVTSVTSGSKVTLTAAVTSGSTKVTVGQVNFCDASVTYCTDIHLLGTAQLTKAGTATIKFRPGVGSHSYKAVFAGTPNGATAYAVSNSGPTALSVTGGSVTTTQIAQSGNAGDYTLTATVSGFGSAAPTGTVSFLDASNANAVLGTATLTAGTAGFNFVLVQNGAPGEGPSAITTGDFNGDGILDLATANGAVLLGNGDGTFTEAESLPASVAGSSIVVGDFNEDGIPDLAIANEDSNNITVLLGYGDGTFTAPAASLPTGDEPMGIVTADFNGDGIPDLAVANAGSNTITVLLGNGDGTFIATSASASPATGSSPESIAVGDFNGDGIPDLAVANEDSNNVTILLGNGNGAFTATATSPSTGDEPTGIVTADFSANGMLDLAVADGGGVTVLLGDGTGNFVAGATSTLYGDGPVPIVIGDFNGDGIVDLAAVQSGGMLGGYVDIALGNGSGGFTPASYDGQVIDDDIGRDGFSVTVGDFNGDGISDLAAPANNGDLTGGQVEVLLAVDQTATATANGIAVPVATGTSELVASYPGNSTFSASTSVAIPPVLQEGTPEITLSVGPNPASLGTLVTLTAVVLGNEVIPTSTPPPTPTGTVTFYDGSKLLGTGTLNGSGAATLATYATSTFAVGSNSLSASYGGDTNYTAANSAAVALTVTAIGSAVPTVTVTPTATTLASMQTDSVAVSVMGAAGSPTPTGSVTLSSGSYSAQQPIAAGAASFTIPAGALASGANTLTAAYSGDATYAAESATATVTVGQVSIALAIPAPASVSAGSNATVNATLTAGSGYSGTMNLACALTKSPTGAVGLPTCSLDPATASLKSGGSATSVLTLSTTAASSASLAIPSRQGLWGFGGGSAVLAVLFLCGIPARRRRFASMLALLWLVFASLAIGCGGGGSPGNNLGPTTPGTTSGSYLFTVTGTDSASATITTSTTVTLTVQ
jgi:Bacterial Ig-like domain (group 3)/FG-GAP-like repeat/FG-GAP repeat